MSENEVEVFNEYHRQRVSKTPDRIENAIKQFEDNGIEYRLLNEETGHFHCHRKSDGGLYQFWASTGKILGIDYTRGIEELMKRLLR